MWREGAGVATEKDVGAAFGGHYAYSAIDALALSNAVCTLVIAITLLPLPISSPSVLLSNLRGYHPCV